MEEGREGKREREREMVGRRERKTEVYVYIVVECVCEREHCSDVLSPSLVLPVRMRQRHSTRSLVPATVSQTLKLSSVKGSRRLHRRKWRKRKR